eukprot:363520-Chlamydomonas_euryale.AAC.9
MGTGQHGQRAAGGGWVTPRVERGWANVASKQRVSSAAPQVLILLAVASGNVPGTCCLATRPARHATRLGWSFKVLEGAFALGHAKWTLSSVFTMSAYSQFTYGVKMTGVAVKPGLLTRGSRPPRQKTSHSVILTGIPTRTTAYWAAAGPQRAATIPVIDSLNPYVNWPLEHGSMPHSQCTMLCNIWCCT